jgi:hypothetical protein
LKFQLGTPNEAFKCLYRCWEIEPTLERVVEDIESWVYAVDKIIEARGAIVSGLALRHGHRWVRANGNVQVFLKELVENARILFMVVPYIQMLCLHLIR